MPLAGAVAINFSAPLFRHAVRRAVAEGKDRLARGWALVVGFLGVLLVASPGADSFRIGALFALANAVLFGSVTAAVRGMSATELAETLTMYQMVFLTVFFSRSPCRSSASPCRHRTDAAAMIANGLLNGVGQYWWTRALSLAPPPAVGPFYYFSLVWAMIARLLVLGRRPDAGAARRLGNRRRLRAVSALARNAARSRVAVRIGAAITAIPREDIDEFEDPPRRHRPRRIRAAPRC